MAHPLLSVDGLLGEGAGLLQQDLRQHFNEKPCSGPLLDELGSLGESSWSQVPLEELTLTGPKSHRFARQLAMLFDVACRAACYSRGQSMHGRISTPLSTGLELLLNTFQRR